jgi:hypothetical protein
MEEINKTLIRESDGYVNATQLCQAGNKLFGHWSRRKHSKEFIVLLEQKVNADKPLIQYQTGNNNERCTFVHPVVATDIARWISTDFSTKLSIWIEEWKNHTVENNDLYSASLINIIPDDDGDSIEKEIQLQLFNDSPGAQMEVETPAGFIDLVIGNEIIEIKTGINWKHALGQVLAYSCSGDFKPIIYLFDYDSIDKQLVINTCSKFKVKVRFHGESKENEAPSHQRCPGLTHKTEEERVLPISRFAKNKTNKYGYARICKECISTKKDGPDRNRREIIDLPEFNGVTHKFCRLCKEVRSRDTDFYNQVTSADGLMSNCKFCKAKQKLERNEKLKNNKIMEKKCSKCKETRTIDNYGTSKNTSDGFKAWCEPCLVKYK